MWKKLTTVALASMLALSLAACSADDSSESAIIEISEK